MLKKILLLSTFCLVMSVRASNEKKVKAASPTLSPREARLEKSLGELDQAAKDILLQAERLGWLEPQQPTKPDTVKPKDAQ